MTLDEQDLLRTQAQLVDDIQSLNAIHEHITDLLGQISETMLKNKYRLVDRGWWVSGLRLIQQMKKVEIMNAQKREILSKIKKLNS